MSHQDRFSRDQGKVDPCNNKAQTAVNKQVNVICMIAK